MTIETEQRFRLTSKNREFPGKSVLTQIAKYSSIAKIEKASGILKVGQEIEYQIINTRQLIKNMQETSLATLIRNKLERIFEEQSPHMPYSIEAFVDLLSRPDAIVIMAWDKNKVRDAKSKRGKQLSRPVGYLIGYPYKKGDIPPEDRTDENGVIGPEPDEGDLIFDTFATERQGEQVGTTLIELLLNEADIRKFVRQPRRLFTFAVDPDSIPPEAHIHAHPHTRYMLSKHPFLYKISEYHLDKYRGAKAYYMMMKMLSMKERLSKQALQTD